MDRGAWRATVHGVRKESDMTEWLNSIPSIHKALSTEDMQSDLLELLLEYYYY